MAHDLCDDLELVAGCGYDDYLDDFHFHDDDGFPSPAATASGGGASGLQLQLHEQMDYISALDYKEGKDMQGIPWERLNYTREQYRQMRLKEYKSYRNLTRSRSGLEQECKQVDRKDTFYDFQLNTRAVKSTIVHFQIPFPSHNPSYTVVEPWPYAMDGLSSTQITSPTSAVNHHTPRSSIPCSATTCKRAELTSTTARAI